MAWLHEVAVRSVMAIIAVMTAVAAVTVVQMMAAAHDKQSCCRQNHQTK